jgi:hypothetical protein
VTLIRAGFSSADITPEPGLKMEGMPRPPEGQGVKYPLTARTAVFDDGVTQAAIVALDLLFLMPAVVAEFRQAVAAGTRLQPSDVMVACTHTHRAPYVTAFMDDDTIFEYLDFVRGQLVGGMAAAQAALQPATLRVGSADAPGWTFNRRQVYKSDLGEQVGTQGPEWVDHFIRREGPEDSEVQVLVASSTSGAGIGGLVDFACHTTVMGQEPVYSADFPGPLTRELSTRFGGTFAFLLGACGNLWSVDTSVERPYREFGSAHAERMARALADKAEEGVATGRGVAGDRVKVARRLLPIPQRRPTREQVELAKWYLEQAPDDVDQMDFTRRIYGHDYTFFHNSPGIQEWFARETIGMWEWQRRVGTRELIEAVEIQVIAIGDVAFVGYPAEYFTEFGLRTKAQSPFPTTFVAELANGWHGYVPTLEAFDHGGYEPRLGYQSRLVPGAGDIMCDAALDLLQELVGE